ncbi:MAG TPA: YggS family pyridoxal phosphate-dependent enzyme [Dehalococcoidia bacterium]|nr:YggS family pyridoxal phosphate-dependent enzyme [Dehalococcoidia bacterium]
MPLSDIAARVAAVRARIEAACARARTVPDEVTLIAVTKGFPPEYVREAFRTGIRHFGENRAQEAAEKLPELADFRPDVTWHMIGHLQTNKVKTVLGLFDIIQSVDSFHLAEALSRRAPHSVPAFLEVNAAGEPSKFGLTFDELPREFGRISGLPNLEIRGLMTVAPVVADPEEVRPLFRRLREAADGLGLRQLSMGMTDDFEVAVEEGATHIRVGRAIFGERQA